MLDVEFKEDQSRLPIGHGAKNKSAFRRLDNLVRSAADKCSNITGRKLAGWDTDYRHSAIRPSPG